jgi:hypothetical protein
VPKTSEMRESKFLKQSDIGAGALMTVTGCEPHNVAKEGAEPENKWCLQFEETDKPLVLNSTNIQLCEKIFGSDDTDDWIGKRIVLYTDPTISFQGKVVGGIRVRAPKTANKVAAPKAAPKPVVEDLDESDIPFAWLMPLVLPALGLLSLGTLA